MYIKYTLYIIYIAYKKVKSINKVWYFHTNDISCTYFYIIFILYKWCFIISSVVHVSSYSCLFSYCRTVIAIFSHEFQTVYRYANTAIKHLTVVEYITNMIKYCINCMIWKTDWIEEFIDQKILRCHDFIINNFFLFCTKRHHNNIKESQYIIIIYCIIDAILNLWYLFQIFENSW